MKTGQLLEMNYLNSYSNSLNKWSENQSKDNAKRLIFNFIKVNSDSKRQDFEGWSIENLIAMFGGFSQMDRIIEELTIAEFMEILPPEKDYKGAKYQVIDYYSTMEHIEELGGVDTLIGDVGAREFIISYYNKDVFNCNITSMLLMSAIQRAEGKPTLAEEFMADIQRENTIYKGISGKEFKQNKDGTFSKIEKGHLKIVR